jgi:hypothetical protein
MSPTVIQILLHIINMKVCYNSDLTVGLIEFQNHLMLMSGGLERPKEGKGHTGSRITMERMVLMLFTVVPMRM